MGLARCLPPESSVERAPRAEDGGEHVASSQPPRLILDDLGGAHGEGLCGVAARCASRYYCMYCAVATTTVAGGVEILFYRSTIGPLYL